MGIQKILGILLVLLGSFLVIHDVLYHLGLVPGLGRETEIFGIHLHHAYIGIILMVLGFIVLKACFEMDFRNLGFLNRNIARVSIFFLLASLSFLASIHIYPALPSISSPRDIKGCNITGVPEYNWGNFWDNFERAIAHLDLELYLAKQLGLNLIEIYIPYHCFPNYNYGKLKTFMRMALRHRLWVIVTLNDNVYPDNVNYTYIEKHMKAIITAIKSEPNLYAIGVMNEYNGRFGTNITFAKWCIQKIRELTEGRIKIIFDLAYFWHIPWQIYRGLDVDIYSFSIYSLPPFHPYVPKMYKTLLETAEKYLGKPVFLGEFGWRTDGEKPEYNEEMQTQYYREVLENINGHFGWSFWCLVDQKELPEKWGIYTVNFRPKKVVDIIQQYT